MTTRATHLIGKPVISAEGGEKLGSVADLLVDDVTHNVVGVVVAHGLLKHEEVLPADAIQSYGRDAVISRSSALITAQEWRDTHPAALRPADTAGPHHD